jgi:hypothetical protein
MAIMVLKKFLSSELIIDFVKKNLILLFQQNLESRDQT